MVLRGIAPLDDHQWAKVQKMLKEGPTDKSIRVVEEALERVKKIPKDYDLTP